MIYISPFGAAHEKLISRNISVAPHMHGQIISKPLSDERLQRNKWLIKKLKEKHFGSSHKGA